MTPTIRILAVFALLIQTQQILAEDYSAEAEQLIAEIVSVHPDGPRLAKDEEFIAASSELRKVASDTTYTEYAMAMGALFHSVNDGHTAAIPLYGEHPAFNLRFPIRVRRFGDGLYVVAAKGEAEGLLGGRLVAVNGTDIDQILKSFASVSSGGNRAWPMNFAPFVVATPGWLMGFGLIESAQDSVILSVKFSDGSKGSAEVRASMEGSQDRSAIERRSTEIEQHSKGLENFTFKRGCAPADNSCTLVVHLGAMDGEDGQSFEEFSNRVVSEIADPGVTRIVLDLRTNGGGNNELAEPLRRELVRSRFNQYGGIYLLISPGTFSAAMNFATRLEREADIIFVGEPTGSSPNHFGDAQFRKAPLSKIPYIISTLRWQDSEPFDTREWILPDIAAIPNFTDYVAGIDRALDAAALHDGRDMRTPKEREAQIARPWDRKSQHVTWTFFHEAG